MSKYNNPPFSTEQRDAVAAVQKNAGEALSHWKNVAGHRHTLVGMKVGVLDADGMRLYNELLRIEGALVQFKADIDKLKKEDDE